MRSAVAALVGLAAAALVGLAVAALVGDRPQAFTLGVARAVAVDMKPGQELCQLPVYVPPDAAFDAVTFAVGTHRRPGPELEVSVRSARPGETSAGGAEIGRGTLAAGYPDTAEHTVAVGHVPASRTVAVCVTNRGRRSAFVYGDDDSALKTSIAFVDGNRTGSDLALHFKRSEPRSLAALIPAMFDRAALFGARWVGGWTYWVIGLLCVAAVPLLLILALRAAARDAV